MHFSFDDHLIVNGEVVRARDIHHDGHQPDSYLPHEDDAATDCSDVGELSEPENEEGGMTEIIHTHPREEFAFPFQFAHTPLKTSMNEEDDHSPENLSKGKEKERERTATPEPQHQAQGVTDLLRFLIGGHLEAAERKYRYSPYASIDEPRVKGIRGPSADFGESNFVLPKGYHHGRRDMFANRFMTSFRPRRRPLPEFVAGPSRITLDDL